MPEPVTLPALDEPYAVPHEALEAFARDGHACLRGLASPEEIAAYEPIVSEAVQRLNREERPLEERDTYGKAFLQVMNGCRWSTSHPRSARCRSCRAPTPSARISASSISPMPPTRPSIDSWPNATADGARVRKGNHPISEFDRNKWLRGLEEGELAASDLNPVLYSRA